MTIEQAVKDLAEKIGYPEWLAAIGQGKDKIVVYLNGTWKPSTLSDEWYGYKIIFRENAGFAPLT